MTFNVRQNFSVKYSCFSKSNRKQINDYNTQKKYSRLIIFAGRKQSRQIQQPKHNQTTTNSSSTQKIQQLISPPCKLQVVKSTEQKPNNKDIQSQQKLQLSEKKIWRGQTVDVSPLDGSFETLQKTAQKTKVKVLNIETTEQFIEQKNFSQIFDAENSESQKQITKQQQQQQQQQNNIDDIQSEKQTVQIQTQLPKNEQNCFSDSFSYSDNNQNKKDDETQLLNQSVENSKSFLNVQTEVNLQTNNQNQSGSIKIFRRNSVKWAEGVDKFSNEQNLQFSNFRGCGKIGYGWMPSALMQKFEEGSGLRYVPQNVEHIIFRNEDERIRIVYLVQGQGVGDTGVDLDVEVMRISLYHEFKTSENLIITDKINTVENIPSFFETTNDNLIAWKQYFGNRNTEYFRYNTNNKQWKQFQSIEKRIQVDQSNGIMIRCPGGIVVTLSMVKGPKVPTKQISETIKRQKMEKNLQIQDDDFEQQEDNEDDEQGKNGDQNNVTKTKLFRLQSELFNKGKYYGLECRYDLFGNLYDYGFSYSVQNSSSKTR
eukprot:TRINITY_DN33535_c0_g1_i2.p1 TRINITY_DN33535_c0_g1~~TRINITY_DN33535_c0_g1_i2.p1  ORF type:complete len:549 (+),score=73.94 TRINITY_DN33535_c0_g1_i2:28-1647(+)